MHRREREQHHHQQNTAAAAATAAAVAESGDNPARNWDTAAVVSTAVFRQEEEHTLHWRWLGEVMATESRFLFLETNAVVTSSSSSSSGGGSSLNSRGSSINSSGSSSSGTTTAVQQQWSIRTDQSSTAVRQELGGICTFLRFSAIRRRARAVPVRGFLCPPLADLGLVGRCVAGDTEA